uniref:Uncharacterized protein n=1 Tax=Cuerna arida TaxID=1464854 RepID=A0A1B6GNQ0_9HEMI
MYSLLKFSVFLIAMVLLFSQGKCRSLPDPQTGGNGLLGGLLGIPGQGGLLGIPGQGGVIAGDLVSRLPLVPELVGSIPIVGDLLQGEGGGGGGLVRDVTVVGDVLQGPGNGIVIGPPS